MHWSSFCPMESLFGFCVRAEKFGKLTQFCAAFETSRFLRLETDIVEAGGYIGVNMLGKVPLVIFLMPGAHLTSWDEAGRRKCEAWQARTGTRRLPPLRPRGNESSVLSVSLALIIAQCLARGVRLAFWQGGVWDKRKLPKTQNWVALLCLK